MKPAFFALLSATLLALAQGALATPDASAYRDEVCPALEGVSVRIMRDRQQGLSHQNARTKYTVTDPTAHKLMQLTIDKAYSVPAEHGASIPYEFSLHMRRECMVLFP